MKKLIFPLLILTCSCADRNKRIADQIDQLFHRNSKTISLVLLLIVMKEGKVIFEKGYGIADVVTKEKNHFRDFV